MRKRLFLYTCALVFAALLCFFAVSVYVTYTDNINLAKQTVIYTTKICAGLYADNTDPSAFVQAGGDTRITIVAPDGTVLADSDVGNVSALENHLTRPEIQAAASGAPEAFVRHSDTLGVDLIYYALKVHAGGSYVFVRTAIPVAKIDAYLFQSLPLLIFLLVAVAILSLIFIRRVADRMIAPFGSVERKLRQLTDGEYEPEPVAKNYEEIEELTRNIDGVALTLRESMDALREEKNKLNYFINNIGDGLFVVDENKNIALINLAALGIFEATAAIVGKNLSYLAFDKTIDGAVDACAASAQNSLLEYPRQGRTYSMAVKRLPDTRQTMVVLSDVTESRENGARREEFFANASHELKTPLTAIKGFNELTALGNKDEALTKFIDGIARETDRMLSLIGDMLRLSELENTHILNPTQISLAKIVSEVYTAEEPLISEKEIVFEASGDATVTAEAGHVYELAKNLIENATRYNTRGGKIIVRIEPAQFVVTDNGIGISPEEQNRIFERFYRVEKSRSGKSGGTGLGLSIVKHVCALYGWKLSLKSKLGVGTEVSVEFGG